eukprot:355355-Chlamydomonas_euryale.AAC.2
MWQARCSASGPRKLEGRRQGDVCSARACHEASSAWLTKQQKYCSNAATTLQQRCNNAVCTQDRHATIVRSDLVAGDHALVHVVDAVLLPTTEWSKYCRYSAGTVHM